MGKANFFFCCYAIMMSASVLLPNGQAMADEDVEKIVEQVLAATQSAKKQVASAVGEGRFEHKVTRRIDGKEEIQILERGPFTAAYSGKLDFLKFNYEESDPQPEYDAKVYVNDGERLWNSAFSPRFRPHGAEGEIWRVIEQSAGGSLFCVLPNAFHKAWTAIDRFRASNPNTTVELKREDELHVVVLTYAQGYQDKFFIDPTRNYHVVEYQLVMPDGKSLKRVKKYWAQTEDKLQYVQKYVHEDFPKRADSRHCVWSMEFTSFTPNVDLPEALFTTDALGLPPGSRIIDRRTNSGNFLQVEPPNVDRAILETIVGPLPKPKPRLDDLRLRGAR